MRRRKKDRGAAFAAPRWDIKKLLSVVGAVGLLNDLDRPVEEFVFGKIAHGFDVKGLAQQLGVAVGNAVERIHRAVKDFGIRQVAIGLIDPFGARTGGFLLPCRLFPQLADRGRLPAVTGGLFGRRVRIVGFGRLNIFSLSNVAALSCARSSSISSHSY